MFLMSLSIGSLLLFLLLIITLKSYKNNQKHSKKLKASNLLIMQCSSEIEAQKNAIENKAKELSEANNKLLELDKFKEGLVAMIVHDLKNPLNVIINSSLEIETQQAGKRMLNLVMNILDVQKFENARIDLETSSNLLLPCVYDALSQVKFLLEQKSITVDLNCPESIIVNIDFDIVSRVFVNLLTNAIKYTPNNDKIIILCSYEAENLHSSKMVRITVTDNGPGISPDKINNIFDKFSDVMIKKSGGIRSSGLGLTFCKLAIEAHGGVINVETLHGKGSSFWFLLPAGNPDKINKPDEIQPTVQINQMVELSDSDKIYLKEFVEKLNSTLVNSN